MPQMVYKCSYGTMPAVTQPGEIATLCQVVPVVKEVAVHSNTYVYANQQPLPVLTVFCYGWY